MRDRAYAERAAERILEYLLDLDGLRGADRLYVPQSQPSSLFKATALNHTGPDLERIGLRSDDWNQCLHGVWCDEPTTMYPISIAMAATWDPGLIHEVAAAISDEARAIQNLWHERTDLLQDKPLFPFGRGLSYTEFKHMDLVVSPDKSPRTAMSR